MAQTLVHAVTFSHLHLEQIIDEVDSYGETEITQAKSALIGAK